MNYAVSAARNIAGIPNVNVFTGRISWNRYIPISAPRETIPLISSMPHVRQVHYDMPKTIKATLLDPLIGPVRLSKIEIPGTPFDTLLNAPLAPLSLFFDLSKPGYEFIPTSKIREVVAAPKDNLITTKVACLDTGAPLPFHPLATRKISNETVITEPPFDMIGHGVWCHSTAFLGKAATKFGLCEGIADATNSLHVKCMNSMGIGTTKDVLQAMEYACKWGAKVISLSLGGPLQGSALHDDPECKMVNETKNVLWIIAAGNEGKEWSINSPAAAPQALTVGSYSTKYKGVSIFSSKGPNGPFYRDNPEVWQRDLAETGEDLVKPDILAPGGGPCKPGQTPIDLIYSGCQGWTEGEYDYNPFNGFAGMRGTSMAAAVAAGIVALLVERKGIKSTREIKTVMSQLGKKDAVKGYGLLRYDLF